MSVYADSSFVVSLYLTDLHSAAARRRLQGAPPLMLTPFHRAEWAHALSQHEFRGTLTSADARRFDAQFLSDIAAGGFRQWAVPEKAFELCGDLARRHGSKLAMRTLDSLHVACALELGAERFWTFDERQEKLAKAQGLKV
ncbi:MAG TPA: type II toxin-antitoxin system VapC family toxin [Candidatus Binatia bacterium]|nr:type II toxin-antitoxin system VapC family toxin [Candidatus Binatia bacterium]